LLQRSEEQNFIKQKSQNSLLNHNRINPKKFSLPWRWKNTRI